MPIAIGHDMLLLLACASEPEDSGATTPVSGLDFAVDTPGPFHASYRRWEVTYTPPGLDPRTIPVSAWYPTEEGAGVEATDTVGFILTDVFLDAAPAAPVYENGYPVVVHSHGYQGWGGNSFDLARYLATHGWIFLAPDHVGNTLFDTVEPLPLEHYAHRPLDIRAALDSLDADAILGTEADIASVLASGHSFGVYTTWAVGGSTFDTDSIQALCDSGSIAAGDCPAEVLALFSSPLSDDRVVATMPMAGGYRSEWFGAEGYQGNVHPTFFMSGSNDDVGQEAQWEALTAADMTWMEIAGGCHQTFGLGTCDTLEAETGWQIVDTYGLSFARAMVLGDTSVAGILDGSDVVSDLVTVQVR